MGAGRRKGAMSHTRGSIRWLAALALSAVTSSAFGVQSDDSHILYFEPLQLATPTRSPQASAQQKSSQSRELQFDAYGRRFVVSLEPNDKLSPLLQSKSGVTPDVQLYRGQIDGSANSWARLAIADGQWQGMLWDGADLYVIEPVAKLHDSLPANAKADGNATAIFRLADVVMTPGAASCGSDTTVDAKASKGTEAYSSLLNELKGTPAIMQALGASKRLEISALGDSLFMNRYGTEAQARAEILLRLNNVDGIFSSQLGVEITVPSIDIGDSLSSTTAASSLLSELADLRKRSRNLYSRGLTHMFTGRDLDGTTVGIAYMDSLCDSQWGVGLSEASSRSAWTESLIAAHEIGHNFGAPHDGDAGGECASTPIGQYLMSPSINGSDRFSACSTGVMQPNIAAASCITALSAADVQVAANLGVARRPVGRSFDWQLTVVNSGGLATANTRAQILLPPVIIIEDAFVVGGTCTSGAGVIVCDLGQITGGGSAVVSLSLRSAVAGSNSISVDVSAANETNTSNNHGEGTIDIEPEADLAVSLQAPPSTAAGTAFTTSLSARNLSSIDANAVTITMALPAGVTASEAAFNGGACSVQGSSITCSLASVAAGATVTGTATLTAATAGNAVLQAQISGNYFDPVTSNDTAAATVSVTGAVLVTAQSSNSGGGGGGAAGVGLLSALFGLLSLKNLQRRR